MRNQDQIYHRVRAQQCREMAALAVDPEVRRRHEELAAMHASQAGIVLVQPEMAPAV